MYEYVSKREFKPYREEVEKIIRKAQQTMKKRYNTTFQYQLIGSANQHLVTKIKNGNKGYDFDYNLILQKSDLWNCPQKLKQQFMTAFSDAVKGTPYKVPEDSTSAITMKVVDKKNSRIIRSCDLAIIYYLDEDDTDKGYMYLRNWKNGWYSFEKRRLSNNADSKLDAILEYEQGWNMIREEYLKIKNNNKDKNKKSFILYLESIHNVYNHLSQYEEEKQENQWFSNSYTQNLSLSNFFITHPQTKTGVGLSNLCFKIILKGSSVIK